MAGQFGNGIAHKGNSFVADSKKIVGDGDLSKYRSQATLFSMIKTHGLLF